MNSKNLTMAAMSGLFAAGALSVSLQVKAQTTNSTSEAAGECHGVNSCKGQGDCGGKGHSCAGKNSCKGKGWIKMSKDECDKAQGKFKAEKGS